MIKKCRESGEEFEISEQDLQFYTKMQVPPPTLCPAKRKQRRLAWQNMQSLYRAKCAATAQDIISIYSPAVKFPVYSLPYWWSDQWNVMDYGQDYDPTRPFFSQFFELMNKVPHACLATSYSSLDNSGYINYASYLKNCYLVFHTSFSEDCMYTIGVKHCKDVLDCFHVYNSELCYDCLDCDKCFSLKYSMNCEGCSSSSFLRNCIGCSDCFGCVNLKNKKYYIFNQKYNAEQYSSKLQELKVGSRKNIELFKNKFKKWVERFPVRAYQGYQNEDVSGDWLYHCNNVHDSFSVRNARDCRYCQRIYDGCVDCYDVDQFGNNAELMYECECCGVDVNNLRFCSKVRNNSNFVDYSLHCFASSQLFGCVGLKNKRFCIFNRQYSESEYFALKQQIIANMQKSLLPNSAATEWGEFFPIQDSPFAYNETIAYEEFRLTKEEVLANGWKWKDIPSEAVVNQALPDDISEVKDDILNVTIYCEKSGRKFKIQKKELDFYRSNSIPLPVICPDERHRERLERRNKRKLYRRVDSDGKSFFTTYAPDYPGEVLLPEKFAEAME